ncbi:MAG: hypothetical protein KAS22_03620 [Candidatus Heimdallarchaeota archaeon]|nr:hypothetical protein [Candidatus Heimdallarchaeota archaeon]
MTSNNSDNSDVGFIVLISFAVLALIPLVIGFDSFEELLRVGKIILIVVLVVTVVAGIIFGYLFYKRKIGKRNAMKEKKSNEKFESKKQGNVTEVLEKRNSEEIEIVDPIFDETDEVNLNLKQIKKEYDF